MVRTQIYLTDEEHEGLRALAQKTGRTQSELIRQAVDALLADEAPQDRESLLRQARGLWRERTDLPDFRAMRQEMDRDR